VTVIVKVFAPIASESAPDAAPDVRSELVPDPIFASTDALIWLTVGVIVIDETLFATVTLYVEVELLNVGDRVPEEMTSDESVLSLERLLDPLTLALPPTYEVREVVTVRVAELPGFKPETVISRVEPLGVPTVTVPAVVVGVTQVKSAL
jgi:hypothetical protein